MPEDIKILVVDDELRVLKNAERAVKTMGYSVEDALSGKEATIKMEKSNYNLVLTDLKMPGMDGIEVQKEIKERWPETKVLIMTGYQSIDPETIEAERLIASDYIGKSFTPDTLIAAVDKVLREK